jgi:hypothetical protein
MNGTNIALAIALAVIILGGRALEDYAPSDHQQAQAATDDLADAQADARHSDRLQRTAQRVCIAAMGPTSRVSWTPENELRCLPGDRSQGGAL